MVKKKETPKKEVKKAKEDIMKGYKTEMEIEAGLEKESEILRLERLSK